jgi:hypothetical protein
MILGAVLSLLMVMNVFTVVYAQSVTVKGEVIDTYCYALMGQSETTQYSIDCIRYSAGLLEKAQESLRLITVKAKRVA